jgi:inward rectifier potassium channel
MKTKRRHITVRAGHFEFVKLNTEKFDWRDAYHLILTLSWPGFAAFLFCVYVAINFVFAILYLLGPNSIAEMSPGSFSDAFFFSVETLATVGYGHFYPVSLYGHIIATLEIMVGMFGLAVITGVIFVRFSRPTAKIHFSKGAVICPFDGVPTLMVRVANLRHQAMMEAHFTMILVRSDVTVEGEEIRRFIPLKLTFDHLIAFPAVLTLRHGIDQTSPLYGMRAEDFERFDVRIIVSIVAIDTVIPAPIESASDYNHDHIEWGRRFVEIYRENKEHQWTVDYGRIDETEEFVTAQNPVMDSEEETVGGTSLRQEAETES